MTISFRIRKEKISPKTGLAPLMIRVSYNELVVIKNVPNIKIAVKDWNYDDYSVSPSKKNEPYNNHKEYNILLSDIKYRLNELYRKNLLSDTHITKVDIENAITCEQSKHQKAKESTFLENFQEFINHSISFKAQRTITGYHTTLNTLINYFQSRNQSPTLESIDLRFFDDFRNYCFHDKKFKDNYFAKLITHLKTFMKWSFDREYHNNVNFLKFRAPEHDIEVIFLTQQELYHLYNFQFKSEKLSKARDIFCFSCFTGLRYSDLANLQPSNFIDGQIKINVKKTRQKDLVIPLVKYAKAIIEKYQNTVHSPLPLISSQKLNAYIKEACKEAGIDTPTRITRHSGGTMIDETYPKYNLITMHTGRKTFVSNSLMLDIPTAAIKEVTGHRTDKVFQKYVKVTDEFKREKFKAWDTALS